jgi:hypothetical protein
MGLESIEQSIPLIQGRIASKVMAHLHNPLTTIPSHRDIILSMAEPYMSDNEDKITVWPYAMIGFFDGYISLKYHTMKCKTEVGFLWSEPDYPKLTGYIDRIPLFASIRDKEENGEKETIGYEDKYSGKPNWYEMFTLKDQITIYFLGKPSLERMTTRILVHPELRLAKNESIKDYISRVSSDVIRRPKHYVRDMTYWGTEFDYHGLKWKIRMIASEIVNLVKYGKDGFYQNTQACFTPPCQFKHICSSNDVISETLYRKRQSKAKQEQQEDSKLEKYKEEKNEKISDSPWADMD